MPRPLPAGGNFPLKEAEQICFTAAEIAWIRFLNCCMHWGRGAMGRPPPRPAHGLLGRAARPCCEPARPARRSLTGLVFAVPARPGSATVLQPGGSQAARTRPVRSVVRSLLRGGLCGGVRGPGCPCGRWAPRWVRVLPAAPCPSPDRGAVEASGLRVSGVRQGALGGMALRCQHVLRKSPNGAPVGHALPVDFFSRVTS